MKFSLINRQILFQKFYIIINFVMESIVPKELLERIVAFRQQLHQNPQVSFQQFQTRQRVKKILLQLGVQKQQMVQQQPTILIVDLTGCAQENGCNRCIAFRVELDGLSMQEQNQDIPYKSQNKGAAHMCGHDGHMASLIGFVGLFMKVKDKIPKNKKVRLLFQPSQQGPLSGARLMIKNGCLSGVDQIYGFHQSPAARVGQLWCRQGPVMFESTVIDIQIIGTGGHGSQPQMVKDAIKGGMKFYLKAMDYFEQVRKQKSGKFLGTLPVLRGGQRYNVFSQKCIISGGLRSLQQGLKYIVLDKLKEFLKQLEDQGYKTSLKPTYYAPMNTNTRQQAEHVLRIGREVFGADKVGDSRIPFCAGQDFAYYTKIIPGAYFFLSSARQVQKHYWVHSSRYNFNDQLLQKAPIVWYKLALDRLEIKIQ